VLLRDNRRRDIKKHHSEINELIKSPIRPEVKNPMERLVIATTARKPIFDLTLNLVLRS
jgi:hypothetical protein